MALCRAYDAGAMASRTSLHASIFLVGFCGLIAQVVVVREMVVTFHGNELSIGVMLGSWLLWTGLGSLGLGRVLRWCRRPGLWLSAALLVGAVVLLGTVVGARALKLILAAGEPAVGQVRPFRLMLTSCLGLLGPFCLLNGFFFPLACRAVAAQGEGETGAGRVYVLEAAGAALGGVGYSFVLVYWLEPLLLAFLLAGALCAGAAVLAWPWAIANRESQVANPRFLFPLALGGLVAVAAASVAGVPSHLAARIDSAYWRPRLLVSTADSRFARLSVVRQPQESVQRSLFRNGTLAFTYPDAPAAEAAAHLPMVQHPRPRRVLLLGGALAGLVEEVLEHPYVERVVCVVFDPLEVDSARRHFPPALARALADPRVRLAVGDGRALLKRTEERFDVVINAQGPPATAQANRLYTQEFFREVARVLRPGGVFAFRAAGGHNYVREENRRLLACLYRTAAAAFDHVIAFPGAQVHFLASNQRGVLTYQLDVLQRRLDARGIVSPYADAHTWESQLVGGRLEELEGILAEEPPPALNRDLAPRCYYYEAQRWSAIQRTRQGGARRPWFDLGRLLARLDRQPALAPLVVLALLAAASLAVLLLRRREKTPGIVSAKHPKGLSGERFLESFRESFRAAAVAFAVASTGLIEMAVEFVVLLGFQVAYGYVYHYVGVLVASFMFGLALGGWVSSRWVRQGKATWGRLMWVQGAICAYPLCLLGFLLLATRTGLAAVPLFAALSFSAVALIAGLVGGLQFPLAIAHCPLPTANSQTRPTGNRHSAMGSRQSSWAGTLYGLDLFGSCLGALAVSSVLVPVFGLGGVCVMLSGLGALGMVGLMICHFRLPIVAACATLPQVASLRKGSNGQPPIGNEH